MKYAHNIRIRVFTKDNEEQIRKRLIELIPSKKTKVERTVARGLENDKIIIYQAVIKNNADINKFLNKIKEPIRTGNIEERIDDQCNLYLRLDKEAMLRNKLKLTYGGNCFHIRIAIAAYPAKKEKALKIIKEFLDA